MVPYISEFFSTLKDALKQSVLIGCGTFPNEVMRFHSDAKPGWNKIQELRKKCSHLLNLALTGYVENHEKTILFEKKSFP